MTQDDSTEHIREEIQHKAQHEAGQGWIAGAALTAAVLAALAAIGGMLGGVHLTLSGRAQIESNDEWGQYQAKSIKMNILRSKLDLMEAIGTPKALDKERGQKDLDQIATYQGELGELKEKAEANVKASERHLHKHEVFERGVTLFHIAIAIVAIAVLIKRRSFWYASMACGVIGIVFLILAFGSH